MKRGNPNRTQSFDAHVDEVAIPEGLVKFLRVKFPYKRPRPQDHLDDIMHDVGFQDCIDALEALRERQLRRAEKSRTMPDGYGRV